MFGETGSCTVLFSLSVTSHLWPSQCHRSHLEPLWGVSGKSEYWHYPSITQCFFCLFWRSRELSAEGDSYKTQTRSYIQEGNWTQTGSCRTGVIWGRGGGGRDAQKESKGTEEWLWRRVCASGKWAEIFCTMWDYWPQYITIYYCLLCYYII